MGEIVSELDAFKTKGLYNTVRRACDNLWRELIALCAYTIRGVLHFRRRRSLFNKTFVALTQGMGYSDEGHAKDKTKEDIEFLCLEDFIHLCLLLS